MMGFGVILSLGLALVAALAVAIAVHFHGGREKAEADLEATRGQVTALTARVNQEQSARATERKLVIAAHAAQEKADEEKRDLAARYDALRDSVRKRPERPAPASDVPAPAADAEGAQGCTGAELYRGDAEAFIRLAERADELRRLFKQYEAAQQAAEGELNGEK